VVGSTMLRDPASLLVIEGVVVILAGAVLVLHRLRGTTPSRAFPLYVLGLAILGALPAILGSSLPDLRILLILMSGLAVIGFPILAALNWRKQGPTRTTQEYLAVTLFALMGLVIALLAR